jgi:acetyltransferase
LPIVWLSCKVYCKKFNPVTLRGHVNTIALEYFFSPKGVAVIGASQDPTKLGYALARNLKESDYPGKLHFVNPRGGTLFGESIYTTVSAVPDPVDLAVLLIPAEATPQALRECGLRGIRAAIIAAGGFREASADGQAIEAACVEIARTHQMRLIGPNCVGIIDTHLPMNATFLSPPGPLRGDLALLSQSGAICAVLIDWARSQDLGFSRLVSLGNQADVNETDLLETVASDPETRVISLYIEGIGNGRKFLETARAVTRRKPVVALKVGRYASGQRAAASHTGSLVGQDEAYSAAFKRCGVIRANTSEELLDWARALAWCPASEGRRVAVLTNAGGPGVMASDALEACGLTLADLNAQTRAAMAQFLPAVASVQNPVDLLASATPQQFDQCLKLLLQDSNVDSVLVILVPPPLFDARTMFSGMTNTIQTSAKPVVAVLMGEAQVLEAAQMLRKQCIPEYRFPERAAAALQALAERGEYLRQPEYKPALFTDIDRWELEKQLSQAKPKPGWLDAGLVEKALAAYGIPTLPQHHAGSPEEAELAAEQMGLGQDGASFALKIISPDLPHKSDSGGVILNVRTGEGIRNGYQTIMQRVHKLQPSARILGITVQKMAPAGQEVILGAVQDATFGPLMMFGSGGTEVEGLKDIRFGIGPLSVQEGEEIIQATWAGRKLDGYRSLAAADRQAVLEAFLRLSQLAADYPQFKEIEINPLRAFTHGVYALDSRIRLSFE